MATNQITGTVNDDILLDTVVDDEIFALDGNDEIETSSDSDTIYGDAGTDTLSVNYSSYVNDLNINVSSYDIFSPGDGLIDVNGANNSNNYINYPIYFYSIEQLKLMGGDGNDTLGTLGSYSYNNIVLEGTINGGAGDDFISPGKGFDVVDGGTGYDFLELDFNDSPNGVTSNLSNGGSGEYITNDRVVEFSNIEAVGINGSIYDDSFVVPAVKNNSTFLASIPFIYGGDGFDEIVVDLSDSNEDLSITDSPGLAIYPDYINEVSTDSIESYNITSGRGDDNIRLEEYSGVYRDDVINAGAGNDTIATANGYDVVDGGSGYDVLELSADFSYSSSRITSHLENSNSGEYTSDEGTVEFTNIEEIRVYGSHEDDVLAVPVSLQNSPTGTNSYIDGGDGLDEIIVDLSDRNDDLSIDNVTGLNINSPNQNTYLDIYNIEGFDLTTGRGDDNIILNNSYSDDTVNTGAGNDVINTGNGYDVVDGGSGYDLLHLDFAASFSGVSSNLTDGNSGEYISYPTAADNNVVEFSNIEAVNVTGSSYNDVLAAPIGKGDGSTLPLSPYIDGGEGFDELVVNLSDRNEDLSIDNVTGLNINSPNHNSYLDIYSIEGFDLTTGRGDDNIILNNSYSDDTVNTGAGNDIIDTGNGYDVIDGGSGYDLLNLDFGTAISGVTSSLSDGNSGEYVNLSPVDNNVVEFSNIEAVNVIGSSYNDVLAAPIGKGDGSTLPLSPYINGGEGFDELVVNLSDRNDNLSIDNLAPGLNINSPNHNSYLDIYSIEAFDITTGRGDDEINLNNGNYSDDTVNTGTGDDIISTGNGHDVVDGGSGYDLLNLNFSTALSGVTSSLSDGNSGEYVSDEGAIGSNVVEFSNIEAVNVTGSSYNDVLAMPIGNSNGVELPFAPSVDGGEGFDEVVIDLSDRNDNIFIDNFAPGLNINYASYFDNFDIYSVEAFDITTGRGDDDIFLDQSVFSNETIDAGAGDDYITAGKGDDVVDGGKGYDLLSLDFSNALSGVTSSLSDSDSGEYFTDDSSVEFSNIEAISVWGSAYDDVLVVPLGTGSTNREFPSFPEINGGEGFDELVVDYSEVRSDLNVYSGGGGNLSISIPETGNFKDIRHFDLEKINLTTGEGNDNINLDTYGGSHLVNTGAGDDWISFSTYEPQGNNVIDGGNGFDIINLDYASSFNEVTASYTNDGSILYTTDNGTVEFSNIEAINVTGSDSDDVLIALSGDSSFYGTSGFTSGGNGSDTIHGSDDNDTLYGENGNDSLLANDGDDYLDGYDGDDTLRGGNGDDYLYGGDGLNVLYGDAGNDVIDGDFDADIIYGGDGDDSISDDGGLNVIFGDAGNDSISGGFDADEIDGGDGNDTIDGYYGNDTLFGSSGSDSLEGNFGMDSLDGGGDNDILLGGADNDILKGDSGNDTLYGGDGDDTMFGGENSDRLYGEVGNDTLDGGDSNDTLAGEAGDDSLIGGASSDILSGGEGQDTLEGRDGNDRLYGKVGDDILLGGDGNDYFSGSAGNDTLYGGNGDDTMFGGGDSDIFALESGLGSIVVNDFTDGTDFLGLTGSLDFNDLNIVSNSTGTSTIIEDLTNNNTMLAVLTNVDVADIAESDFVAI